MNKRKDNELLINYFVRIFLTTTISNANLGNLFRIILLTKFNKRVPEEKEILRMISKKSYNQLLKQISYTELIEFLEQL